MEEKYSLVDAETTKAKLKAYGYTTGFLTILLVGSFITNAIVCFHMYQRLTQVSYGCLQSILISFKLKTSN